MNGKVVIIVEAQNGPEGVVCCSIECARRHGYEPVRLVLKDEDNPCAFGCDEDSEEWA